MNKMIENLLFYKTFLSKKKPRLPKEYQEVEWIKGDGTAYLSLPHGTLINPGFAFKFKKGYDNTYTPIIMRDDNSTTIGANIGYGNVRATARTGYVYYGGYSIPNVSPYVNINTDCTVLFNDVSERNMIMRQNDVDYQVEVGETPEFTLVNIAVLKNAIDAVTLYYLRITDNYVPVYDLIPCYRKADGVIGMYDLVSKTFYTNAGTGTFTKGADITSPYSYLTSTNTTRYPEVLNGLKVLTFDGSETWFSQGLDATLTEKYNGQEYLGGMERTNLIGFSPDYKVDIASPTTSIDNTMTYTNVGGSTTITGNIFLKDTTHYTSADDWKAYLQQHPVKLLTTVNTPDSSVWRSVIRKKDKVTGYLNEATGEFIPVYEGIPYAGDGRKMMMMRSPIGDEGFDLEEPSDFDNLEEPLEELEDQNDIKEPKEAEEPEII